MSRWRWLLLQLTRQLWLRATLIGFIGVAAAVLAAVAERFIPWNLPDAIQVGAVDSILNIIASSMLAVTTFSLSVMTSAYSAATNNVTPRATKLLMEDRITQNVLSTFLGSFIFGIVGIVVLKTGAYGDRGRAILFLVTIGVIAMIVVTLLRWIDHLTRLGRVGETTSRVETAAKSAIEARTSEPYLGGVPLSEADREPPATATIIKPENGKIGYILHIDIGALSRCANELGSSLHVLVNPGTFVYADTPLAWCAPPDALSEETVDELAARVQNAFDIGIERSFDQDPRFGLVVMSEIASRALSPAVNDPGTAIDVIGRLARLMSLWGEERELPEPSHPAVHILALSDRDLLDDAFMPIARDGAGIIEVQLRLHKSLHALSRLGTDAFREAALEQARTALGRADAALTLKADRDRLGLL